MALRRLSSLLSLAALVAILAFASTPALAQEPTPSPAAERPSGWPTGDALRRELQDIGFAFRVERSSGDWLGWAPRATPIEAPALTLGGEGSAPAWTRATFKTLETDLLGRDVDGALTAVLEVASRTPLPQAMVTRAFRFVVDDLLVEVPVLQAECYASESSAGVIVIRVDTETGEATLLLAESAVAHPDGEGIEECSAISARVQEEEAGRSRSERLTIAAVEGGGFDPVDASVEGLLVTVVLTVRNDDAIERSLTFAPPLDVTTGPIAPGASTLIILRRLEVGEYIFGDTDAPGLLSVVAPSE